MHLIKKLIFSGFCCNLRKRMRLVTDLNLYANYACDIKYMLFKAIASLGKCSIYHLFQFSLFSCKSIQFFYLELTEYCILPSFLLKIQFSVFNYYILKCDIFDSTISQLAAEGLCELASINWMRMVVFPRYSLLKKHVIYVVIPLNIYNYVHIVNHNHPHINVIISSYNLSLMCDISYQYQLIYLS